MTFISRCSAETLKNITFFEKFGKKNAKFFSLFFPFFRGFSGKFFPRFFVVYTSLQSGFPKWTPEFPEIPGGKFREIFGHFFVDFSEKKSGNLEGLPCVPKRKLKKTRFFSKNRRNKKKPTLFFRELFFFPPDFSGGPFRETSTQHSLKPQKMVIFPENFRKFLSFSGIFGGHNFRKNGHFWPNFGQIFLEKSSILAWNVRGTPAGTPPGNSGENFGEFPGISGNFRGDIFPEIPGIFSGGPLFRGKNTRILGV